VVRPCRPSFRVNDVSIKPGAIQFCRHGYSSSLAAWNLRQLGLSRATDMVGGYDAWVEAGLPTTTDPADERP